MNWLKICLLSLVLGNVLLSNAQSVEDIEKNYDGLYIMQSGNHELTQKLYVLHLDGNKLMYKLVIIRELCEMEYAGVAVSKPGQDAEIDEDEEGEAYPAMEFTHTCPDWKVIIREGISRDRAKISFEGSNPKVAICLPVNHKMMYSE